MPCLTSAASRSIAACCAASLRSSCRRYSLGSAAISIAASGLHTIAELAQKNLKAAEQIGPKLQEKINENRMILDDINKEIAKLNDEEEKEEDGKK